MPQCVKCPKKQRMLNAGDLCKTCLDKETEHDANEEDNDENIITEEELDKPINIATLRDISNIIKKFIDPVFKKMEKLIKPIKEISSSNTISQQ